MGEPLNPTLYRRLRRQFGHIAVKAEGEAMIARPFRDVDGQPRIAVAHTGEYYCINCPYCNDTRHRLWVNHMFGKEDGHGRRMTFLAVCYNEYCLDRHENREDFLERIDDNGLIKAVVKKGIEVPEEAREVQMPGPCTPIHKLPPTHKARAYLADRRFEAADLWKKYRVSYCTDSHYSLARNRIIIPVFENDKLKGWQARLPEDLDWKGPRRKELPPKYFTCPESKFRSKCIYNFGTMREWETAVVVEGPTDAWRFGLMAGCIFGNTVTEVQRKKLLAVFARRTVVLLLDPEEFDSKPTRKFVEFMQGRMSGKFCAVKLPDGTDPGKLDREFLREYVREQAAAAGVRVRYKRVG